MEAGQGGEGEGEAGVKDGGSRGAIPRQAGLLNQLCPHAAALNKQAALVAIPRGGVGPPPSPPPRYPCFSSSFSSTSSSLLPPLLRSRKCLQLLKLLEYRDLLLTGVFFFVFLFLDKLPFSPSCCLQPRATQPGTQQGWRRVDESVSSCLP